MSNSLPVNPRTRFFRNAMAAVALLVLTGVGLKLLDRYLNSSDVPRPIDFLQVWSASHLHLAGANPYDAAQMYELQRANRLPDERASMMWNPPWALAVVMPLGMLSVNAAQVVWLIVLFSLIAVSVLCFWYVANGSRRNRWVAIGAALAFAPTWFLIVGGQISAIPLFGIAGFLLASRFNRPLLAGMCISLTAIKPHLFVPLAVGLSIDAMRSMPGRRVVYGGLLVLVAASIIVTVPNSAIWHDYLIATTGGGSSRHKAITEWMNPTLGAWVRAQLPGNPFWVQWVPSIVAATGFGVYWWRHGGPERWYGAIHWVIPLGLLTAPYGSWMCDQVLLLVAIISLLARWDSQLGAYHRVRPAIALYGLANGVALLLMVRATSQEYYVWFAPVVVCSLAWASAWASPCREHAASALLGS